MPSKKSKPSVCFEPANTAEGYEQGYKTGVLSVAAASLILDSFVRQQALPHIRTYAECEVIGAALQGADEEAIQRACTNALILEEFDLFCFVLGKKPDLSKSENSYADLVYRVIDRSLAGDEKWLTMLIQVGFPVSSDRRPVWDLAFAMAGSNSSSELMRTLDLLDNVCPIPKGQQMLDYLMEHHSKTYETFYPVMCVSKRAHLEIVEPPIIPLTSDVELR